MLKPLIQIALKLLHLQLKTNQLLYRYLWKVCVKEWCMFYNSCFYSTYSM